MSDQFFIYVIVSLNILCQLMLIWRQKLDNNTKWKYCSLAIAIPLVIMVLMRLFIASGAIHGRIVEQSPVETIITYAASVLLIAGPWFVSIAAVCVRMKSREVGKNHVSV